MTGRVFVSGIWRETNSFARQQTDLEAFRAYQYAEGEAMRATFAGTNTEIGGMLDAMPDHGLTPVLGLFAGAVPSGMVSRGAFARLLTETCRRAKAAGPMDGVLLALHGAMVADGTADADVEIAARLREVVGPEVPLIATFDIHASLSERLFAAADLLIGYDTYPHTDMAERGREAAAHLARILETGGRPAKAFRKLPLLTAPQTQGTDDVPMRDLIAALHEEERPGSLWSASIAVGFPTPISTSSASRSLPTAMAMPRMMRPVAWRRRSGSGGRSSGRRWWPRTRRSVGRWPAPTPRCWSTPRTTSAAAPRATGR